MAKKSAITMYFKGRDDNIVIRLTEIEFEDNIIFITKQDTWIFSSMSKPKKIQNDEDSNSVFPNIFRTYEDERGVHDVRRVLFIHQFHILINWWIFLKHKVVELKKENAFFGRSSSKRL